MPGVWTEGTTLHAEPFQCSMSASVAGDLQLSSRLQHIHHWRQYL